MSREEYDDTVASLTATYEASCDAYLITMNEMALEDDICARLRNKGGGDGWPPNVEDSTRLIEPIVQRITALVSARDSYALAIKTYNEAVESLNQKALDFQFDDSGSKQGKATRLDLKSGDWLERNQERCETLDRKLLQVQLRGSDTSTRMMSAGNEDDSTTQTLAERLREIYTSLKAHAGALRR